MDVGKFWQLIRSNLRSRADHYNVPFRLASCNSLDQPKVYTLINHTEIADAWMRNVCLIFRVNGMQSCLEIMLCVNATWKRMNIRVSGFFHFVQTVTTRKYQVCFCEQFILPVF